VRWNLAIAALATSWGFIAVIVAHVNLSAEALVFWRVSIATVALGAGLAVTRRLDLIKLPQLRGRVVLVGALLVVHWWLFFETIKLSSVAVALVTVYTGPLFLAVLAPLVLPEARSRVALAAVVPGGAGIVLIALAGDHGAHARPLALAAGLGAAITYACLVIGSKFLTTRLSVLSITFWEYVIATIAVAPFLGTARLVPRGGEIGYLLILGAIFTALNGALFLWLLRRVTAQAVGIISYLEPVSGALLAWAILGQSLGWQVAAGGALVLAAGLTVVLYEPVEPLSAVGLPAGDHAA
jgi:drug/metabolite transporter (DMT)-like permease